MAVVITKKIESKVSSDSKSNKEDEDIKEKLAKLVVFGDSDFITNQYYSLQGNSDLFLRAVNWLAEERELIAIRPKKIKYAPLTLTPLQGRIIFYSSVIILPLVILIIGIKVWLYRRSL